MAKPKALVVAGDGINCDYETVWALSAAGFEAVRMHDSQLLHEPQTLLGFQLCALPGGFSFGDEIASGKVLGVKLKERLNEALYRFIDQGSLLLGICNGFQVLVQVGLLPHSEPGQPRVVSLLRNAGGKFINRWVKLIVDPAVNTPFFQGLSQIELPMRHGEGRLTLEPARREPMEEPDPDHPVDAYDTANETLIKSRAPLRYAEDVNGSFDRVAALTNEKGNVLGLMPHPEAYVRSTQHPAWTSKKLVTSGAASAAAADPDGLRIFKNAAGYFA